MLAETGSGNPGDPGLSTVHIKWPPRLVTSLLLHPSYSHYPCLCPASREWVDGVGAIFAQFEGAQGMTHKGTGSVGWPFCQMAKAPMACHDVQGPQCQRWLEGPLFMSMFVS